MRISILFSSKTLSLLFDAHIAYGGYLILKKTSGWAERKEVLLLAAVILFTLPTVMMNSSLWGQSDSLYAAGVMFALYYLLVNAPLYAAIAFGIALSFKIQTIFFAPIFVGYMLRNRARWKYLLLPPLVFLLTILPAWFSGGNLWYWLFIYAKQAGEYPYLSVSGQSIFALVQPLPLSTAAADALFWLGLIAAGAVALFLFYLTATLRALTARALVLLACSSALLLPYLLPRMHERYFYLADIFSVLYAFYEPRRILVPCIIVFASLISYMPFLSQQVGFLSSFHIDLRVPALLLLIPIGYLLIDVWRLWRENQRNVTRPFI